MEYPDAKEKTILITGANSGIGRAAADAFASLGSHVIMACRSNERGMQAYQQITTAHPNAKVTLMTVDLASQGSIRKFSEELHQKVNGLNVLINNAANFDLSMKKPILTKDGIETIFATNHIGPFLLTHLLMDLLTRKTPSRIINIASKGLVLYPGMTIDFHNLNGEKKYSPQNAYYQSKLAQVIFTYSLADTLRGSGVSVHCIQVPNVAIPDDRIQDVPLILRKVYQLKRKMAISPERMAESYVYLALHPDLEGQTGGYWDENRQQVRSNKTSYNRELWTQLDQVSKKLAGL